MRATGRVYICADEVAPRIDPEHPGSGCAGDVDRSKRPTVVREPWNNPALSR